MKNVCDLHARLWLVCDCGCECPGAREDKHLPGCRYAGGKKPGDRTVMVRRG